MATYYRDEKIDSLPRISQQHGLLDSHLQHHRSPLRHFDDPLARLDVGGSERWLHNRSAPSAMLHSPNPPIGGPASHSTQKLVHELHDQVNFCKNELDKKDRLIAELTGTESPRVRRSYDDTTKIDGFYEAELRRSKDVAYRHTADSTRADLAAVQLKYDRQNSEVNELVQENLILKGKLTTLTDHLGSAELESKASRETIMRLVSEISREQKSVSSTVISIESMRAERDAAMIRRNELEREVQLMKERIDANQRAWNTTRQELEHRDTRASSMEHELKTYQYNAQVVETTLRAFRESLASLLSDGGLVCDDSEESIKEQVRMLHLRTHEKHGQVDILENKVRVLNEQLESQVNLQQAVIRRAKEAEDELDYLKTKFTGIEGELASSSLLRDSLRTDKERYTQFLQRMASIMKMDQMALDVGYDMTGDALMSRAEQLVRLESDAVADKTTTVYNLQRRVKNLKEQLESKDLHLELLRKKMHNLEEGLHGRSGLQKDRDDLEYSHKRSRKENERLRGLLGTARETIKDLKTQLLDTSNLKLLSLHQRQTIDDLESEMEKMDRTQEKQSRKITGIKHELEFTEHEKSEDRDRLSTTFSQLDNELRATRRLLEETSQRERQLVDFRQVVARMLGLDVNILAVPDYEVISRLEKLIQAHHSHTLTSQTQQHSMSDLDQGVSYGTGARRSRARSLSPSRRRHIHTTKY